MSKDKNHRCQFLVLTYGLPAHAEESILQINCTEIGSEKSRAHAEQFKCTNVPITWLGNVKACQEFVLNSIIWKREV